MISIRRVAADDAVATSLWDDQQAEMRLLYDDGSDDGSDDGVDRDIDPRSVYCSLLGSEDDSTPVATAMLQWPPYDLPSGAIEAKRLYVVPDARRRGHSRVMMGALEAAARRSGATSIVLETGDAQPAAIALYNAIGYLPIERYGQYRDDPRSVCFAKDLTARVLVINGTMGAGKTTTAAAVFDALEARGSRAIFIDGDYLCQAHPRAEEDPFNQELLFASLAALAPIYRARGIGLIVIARVVEDPDDRDRYATAFASDAGQADLSIVRVDAPEDVRVARLTAREPEGTWRDWSVARSIELGAVLDEVDLDDAVVSTDDRSRSDAASDVLEAAGWA